MSENTGIEDEDLPEDLQPTEDNPLAQDLDEDEAKSPDELDMGGGKAPVESEKSDETDDTDDSED
ncbi:hypothetical protein [Nocardioides caricicola]|uniref:Uncharacterized protein n=1 Tax=Nocardioides caricicola TaxID=634770 RepID=A0ABW0N3N9_9ACTN